MAEKPETLQDRMNDYRGVVITMGDGTQMRVDKDGNPYTLPEKLSWRLPGLDPKKYPKQYRKFL